MATTLEELFPKYTPVPSPKFKLGETVIYLAADYPEEEGEKILGIQARIVRATYGYNLEEENGYWYYHIDWKEHATEEETEWVLAFEDEMQKITPSPDKTEPLPPA